MKILNYELRKVCWCGSSLRVTLPLSALKILEVMAGDYIKFIMEPKTHTVRMEKWQPLSDPLDQPKPI